MFGTENLHSGHCWSKQIENSSSFAAFVHGHRVNSSLRAWLCLLSRTGSIWFIYKKTNFGSPASLESRIISTLCMPAVYSPLSGIVQLLSLKRAEKDRLIKSWWRRILRSQCAGRSIQNVVIGTPKPLLTDYNDHSKFSCSLHIALSRRA